ERECSILGGRRRARRRVRRSERDLSLGNCAAIRSDDGAENRAGIAGLSKRDDRTCRSNTERQRAKAREQLETHTFSGRSGQGLMRGIRTHDRGALRADASGHTYPGDQIRRGGDTDGETAMSVHARNSDRTNSLTKSVLVWAFCRAIVRRAMATATRITSAM